MSRRLFRNGVALVTLLLAGFIAHAQSTTPNVYCSKPIRVALFEFGLLYRSATNDGIDPRLLEILQQRTGCTMERVVMPRARIWNELRVGNLDLATAAIPTPERKTHSYMLPYLKSHNLLLIRKGPNATPQSPEEFEARAMRLGVVRGYTFEPFYLEWVQRLRENGRVQEAADTAELLRFLERGMVDAVISHNIVYPQYLEASFLEKQVDVMDWAPKEQMSIGALVLSRNSFTPEQARQWDKLIATFARDGTLLRIYREFLPPGQSRDMVYTGPRTPD